MIEVKECIIPDKFTVFGQEINVVLREDLVELEDITGHALFRRNEIHIQNFNKPPLYRNKSNCVRSFFHELTHWLLFSMQELDYKSNEFFIKRFCNALHQALKMSDIDIKMQIYPTYFWIFGQRIDVLFKDGLMEEENYEESHDYIKNKLYLFNSIKLNRPNSHIGRSFYIGLVAWILFSISEVDLCEDQRFIALFGNILHQAMSTMEFDKNEKLLEEEEKN